MMFRSLLLLALLGASRAQPSLTFSPAVLPSSGSSLTVKWSGVTGATNEDVVAVKATLTTSAFQMKDLGWVPVNMSAGWASGSGVFSIPLVNMRSVAYSFGYIQAGKEIFSSNFVEFASVNEVTQVHLALTNTTGQASVMWVSATADAHDVVMYGTSPTALTSSASAVSSTYSASNMCATPATDPTYFMDPGALHLAIIDYGSAASTTFYYKVGNSATNDWSAVMSFVTPAPVAASTETFIAVFGDLGLRLPFTSAMEQQPPAQGTIKWLTGITQQRSAQGLASAVFNIGDISYARGWSFLWEFFFQSIQSVAASVPWMVAIGNHEYDFTGQPFHPSWSDYGTDSAGECGVPYLKRFTMPVRAGSGESAGLWYSVDVGNVHVSLVSTEHDFTTGSAQLAWLQQDLAAVNRSVTPWVLVMGHRPMYSSSSGNSMSPTSLNGGFGDHMREYLEPLFQKYNVNMAFYGHVHSYERSCGMSAPFVCAADDSDGTVHIVSGAAGNVYNPDWQGYLPETPSLSTGYHHEQPEWAVFRTMNFGFTTVTTNATHLTLHYIDSARGQVHDELVLVQPSARV